jgi:hypothetical protein
MELEQRYTVPRVLEIDLEERIRLIIEFWGEGKALDDVRIADVAGRLYNVEPDEVRDAILSNYRKGMIKGKFYLPDD